MSAQPSSMTVSNASVRGELVVRLLAGASALSEMAFPIGRAAPLVSVGARGDWQVRGRGVAPVHAMLGSNGAGIFVCVRDGAQLTIDGARVTSSDWVAVPVGATLELGEVRLTVMMSRSGASTSIPAPPSSDPTRAMRLTRARSAEVAARPTAPRIRRRAKSPGPPSLLRDLRSATLVDPCGPPFGATTQIVPPPERDGRSMDETARGPFGTVQLVPPVAPAARPVEAGGPSFGTTQLVPPMAREALPAGSFGTTQLVPPIVRDASAPTPPALATARASLPGARSSSPPIHLPATDAYSNGPCPLAPVGSRAIGGAPRPGIDSFGVTRMVPPTAWQSALGGGHASPLFDPIASTRLAPPFAQRQGPQLASSNVSGGHPLPDPMLGSRMAPASPNGAGPHGLGPGAATRGAPADDSSSARLAACPSASVPHEARGRCAEAPRGADSFVRAWRSSSHPKKAIVVLLGPALLAAVFSLRGSAASPRPPSLPPVASTARASAAPAPSASGAVGEANGSAARARGPAAVAQPPAEVGLWPAPHSKSAQQKTAEHRALDAVAAGAGDAEQYDALAKEYPGNPAFSEAARILRARAAEAR